MSPTRPPRGRDSAPGNPPGAESFPADRDGAGPQGIVRLSDWFCAEDFSTEASSPLPRKRGAARSNGKWRDDLALAREQPPSTSSITATETRIPGTSSNEREPHALTESTADGGGPAYESLFGGDTDTRRRSKRERKPATALQRALGLLTRREHSRKELTRKLVSRGVDAAEVESAVAKLTAAGWQDDRRFAESLVRSRASAGYGPLHIRAELGTHGLRAGVREAALDDFEGDWLEIARDLVARRFFRIDDARMRERKATDFLIRRGFPGDVVGAAARFHHDD